MNRRIRTSYGEYDLMSKRTTVTLEERHLEQLETVKDEMDEDEPSNSAAIRRVFDDAAECDELRNRIESLEHRRDELRNQLAAANERIDASNRRDRRELGA